MPATDQQVNYAAARTLAINYLRNDTARTTDTVRERALQAVRAIQLMEPRADIDVDALIAELLHLFSVRAGEITVLEEHDPTTHVPWLSGKKASIPWRFWTRYESYLIGDFGIPPAVVSNLHRLTDMILERLEDPAREGSWDRRGMVVGSVQSGKTANYIGLINKAIDASYKLIIVLAGIHSNLRSQTQLRIDEGVLGFDTQKSRRLSADSRSIGVGRLPGESLVVHSLTSSAEDGDFNKVVAENIGVMLGGDPVVLVIKKNSRVLGNLIKWVLHVAGDGDHAHRIVRSVPMLLIDDEADNASINIRAHADGRKAGDSVSAINGKIRELLASFEKKAYVGYTATPFANIFINPIAQTERHGEDIFPRSFIINVEAPSNHVGPSRLFGLDGDPDAGIESRDGLPLVREIDDFADDQFFPPQHRKDHVPTGLPPSLRTALRCFVLVCAARRARGQLAVHNSMLVHVTRFVAVQDCVVRLLGQDLLGIQRRLALGDGARHPTIREELRALWDSEFDPTTRVVTEDGGRPLAFEEVNEHLHPAVAKISVVAINGFARDALDYKEHESEGRSVVVVGGDKLSRGLTLEGLSVSYFLRTSRMYDTLMQMGRWFGYRSGYLDLCRLFTTRTLILWYRHIALAEAELRREFDYMVAAGLTPRQYGLRVRTHPDGMIVTALNKMCHSQQLLLSWSGVLVQTWQLPKTPPPLAANVAAAERLLSPLGTESRLVTATRVWDSVPARKIVEFIEELQYPPESARAGGKQLAAFIQRQSEKTNPELTDWTVALVSSSLAPASERRKLAGLDVGLVRRTPESQMPQSFGLKKANILNPPDESLDFREVALDRAWLDDIVEKADLGSDLEWLEDQVGRCAFDVALELTHRWQLTNPPKVKAPTKAKTQIPNGRVVRVLRRRTKGLLLMYPLIAPPSIPAAEGRPEENTGLDPAGPPIIALALSFPTSTTVEGIEYRVNKVWDAEIREEMRYED